MAASELFEPFAPFIGVTYGNVNLLKAGFYRVSDGSRYIENITPNLQDLTADVPGGDGQYYFKSICKNRQFNLQFAFDNVNEQTYSEVKFLIGHSAKNTIAPLIFHETPYKVYMAKITGTPQFKTICFDQGGERIYKGEVSVQLTCYYPFARTPRTDSEGFDGKQLSNYDNLLKPDEWKDGTQLSTNFILGENRGQMPSPFVFKEGNNTVTLSKNSILNIGALQIKLLEVCTKIKWDSRTGLITGDVTANASTKNRPINYTGQSYGNIPRGGITLSNIYVDIPTGEITYRYRADNYRFTVNSDGSLSNQVSQTFPFVLDYDFWFY